jgi:putative inorganic carbon (HCO3(-)) transporter
MKERAIKAIEYLAMAIIMLIVFLVPFYFSFFYQDAPNFALEKNAIFKILVEILLILYLVKIAIKKQALIISGKKYLLPAALFLIALIFTALFSIDPSTSVWGSFWRQQGLFTYLHYFLFLWIILHFLKEKKQIERIINVILLGSFLISLYGILQWLGLEFISWQKSTFSFGRITSTMGQPNFLGSYLLLVVFLTIYKIIVNKNFIVRFLFSLLFIFQFFCLIFTDSRGAWVGFGFGVLLIIFLFLYIKKNNFLKILGIISLVIVFFSSLFLLLNSNSSFASRIKSIGDFKSGSSAIRLEIWSASMAAISKSPFLGYGPETQYGVLAGYYNPNWSIHEDINTIPDRAHNLILDLLLEGGIILLVSYAVFLFYILSKGISFLIRENNKIDWLLFFLIISIASYHFSLLFSFSIVEASVLFWLYIGIMIIILGRHEKNVIIDCRKIKKIYGFLFVYFSIIISCFSIYLIFNNIKSVKAYNYFHQARIDYFNQEYSKMFTNYVLAMNLNNKEERFHRFFIDDSGKTLEKVDSEEYRNSVLDYIKNIIEINKGSSENYSRLLMKAKIFTLLGRYQDKEYFMEAERLYEKLIKISPYMPNSYNEWGRMYLLSKDYEKALIIYRASLAVLPDLHNPYLNKDHRSNILDFIVEVYENMAICYSGLDDLDLEIKYYKKIIEINPYRIDVYRKIADSYYRQGDLDKTILYNKRGYVLNPNDYAWPFSIALLYEELNDKIEAREYAQKALELAPNNRNIKEFLDSTKNK